jgi:hypothetical protein
MQNRQLLQHKMSKGTLVATQTRVQKTCRSEEKKKKIKMVVEEKLVENLVENLVKEKRKNPERKNEVLFSMNKDVMKYASPSLMYFGIILYNVSRTRIILSFSIIASFSSFGFSFSSFSACPISG